MWKGYYILSAFQLFKKPLCSTFIFFCEIIIAQLNAERSAEILFNLLDVDNNGDINEEEFIRFDNYDEVSDLMFNAVPMC